MPGPLVADKRLKVEEKRSLSLAGKALNIQLGGQKISDQLKTFLDEGEFDETIDVKLHVTGNVSPDSEALRYYGVEIGFLIDCAVAIMGCTEDSFRKIACVAGEIKRAELEDRKIKVIDWIDESGESHTVTPEEIAEIQVKITERKERLKNEAICLSQIVQKTVPVKGSVKFDSVDVCVSDKSGKLSGPISLK